MYHACYLFRVPSDRVDRFLQIGRAAATLYCELGAASSTISRVTDGASRYGCLGLNDQMSQLAGEELFVGVDSFADRERFIASMKQIDLDARVVELYHEMAQVIDLSKTVRWESEQVV